MDFKQDYKKIYLRSLETRDSLKKLKQVYNISSDSLPKFTCSELFYFFRSDVVVIMITTVVNIVDVFNNDNNNVWLI